MLVCVFFRFSGGWVLDLLLGLLMVVVKLLISMMILCLRF